MHCWSESNFGVTKMIIVDMIKIFRFDFDVWLFVL